MSAIVKRIESFARTSESGDKSEVADVPENAAIWADVTSTRENCLGTECATLQRMLRDERAQAGARRRCRGHQPSSVLRRRHAQGRRHRRAAARRRTRSFSTRRTSCRRPRRCFSARKSPPVNSASSRATPSSKGLKAARDYVPLACGRAGAGAGAAPVPARRRRRPGKAAARRGNATRRVSMKRSTRWMRRSQRSPPN